MMPIGDAGIGPGNLSDIQLVPNIVVHYATGKRPSFYENQTRLVPSQMLISTVGRECGTRHRQQVGARPGNS